MGTLIILTVCLWGALVFCLSLLSRKTFDHSSEGVAPPPRSSYVSLDPRGKAHFINPLPICSSPSELSYRPPVCCPLSTCPNVFQVKQTRKGGTRHQKGLTREQGTRHFESFRRNMFKAIIPVAACPQGKIWEFSTGGSWTYLGLSSNPSSLELLPAGCLFFGTRLGYTVTPSAPPDQMLRQLGFLSRKKQMSVREGGLSAESKRWRGDGG